MGKFNFKDEQDFEKVRADAETFYAAINKVRCPSDGILHSGDLERD